MVNHCKTGQNGLKQQEVVVVMVPLPAQGHLNQLLQLSRLVSSYNIPVHYVGTTEHASQAKRRVHGWDPLAATNIYFHSFKIPPCQTPSPEDSNLSNRFPSHWLPIFSASSNLIEPVSKLLRALSITSRRVIVIHDSLMASVVQEVGVIPNAESYNFHSVSAFTIFLYIWEQMEKKPIEYSNLLIPEDIPSLEGCFSSEFVDFMKSQYKYHKNISGKVYNTCRVIEGAYMDLLERQSKDKGIKHWALGPFNPIKLNPDRRRSKSRHYCLEWLDIQDVNSVIYVSFGTSISMSEQEIRELAIGLRRSKQKFIWVLRDADKEHVFNGDHDLGRAKLPKGYDDSVEGVGILVRNWAPQVEILAHPAIGGFMSHCGWNSCMESITMGVPIAAWPMHSDQPRNTVLITKLLKIGIVVKDWGRREKLVTSEIVEDSVKILMASKEGDEMRKRAAELGSNVRRSTGEGEVSRGEFDSFIAHITR
ncbi:zeatin O-glucosyltransferase-like [Tripterygium wilfordii]|uniref:Glycosyltransferase n=1 Tax=Tripterygium wilfordii TaxID=458696 RepID=A0A7J7DVA0_TRIWF|nr:zeatin O-glucosyltransferase-like [Tripterygium wilfordii]KAF5750233.1 zeatin O-glucosyltransferase-like [Tripterygium wilfordii]